MTYLYQAVQILYWLVLSTWLGSMVFLALAAPVIFRVARRLDVKVPKYSDGALRDEQPTILAGEMVGAMLARLAQIQMLCASLMFPLLIGQLGLANIAGTNLFAAIIRLSLWLSAVVILNIEWRWHYPKTWQLREAYLASSETPEAAATLRTRFEKEHHRSETFFQATVFLLIGMVMFSANVTPKATVEIAPAAPATLAPAAGK